jgi:Cu+-exporting ATPase
MRAVLAKPPFTLVVPGAMVALACGAVDAAAALVLLVLLGRVVERRVRERLRAAPALRARTGAMATRIRDDGADEAVPIEAVGVGDRVRVHPGEVIPVDGVVLDGISAANEVLLGGDPLPVTKRPGARVAAATTNGAGPLVVHAERVGAGTLAARVATWLAAAQDSAAPLQRTADRLALGLAILAPSIALLVLVVWPALGATPRWTSGVHAALAVVFVASPWALALTTPIATLVAIGKAAAMGIVFRDAAAIEAVRRADVLIIDKSGTLTEGKARLVSVRPTVGFDKQQVLRLAASVERPSQHPLAVAIVAAAEEAAVALHDVELFRALPGQGVSGRVGHRSVLLGSRALMDSAGIALDDLPQRAEPLQAQGQTVVFLAVDGRPAGLVSVADPLRARTPEAIGSLHHEGVRVILLTADSRATAEAVGHLAGVDEIHAELLPDEKAAFIDDLRAGGHVVAMAADAADDAPVLARADVTIAMAAGADVALPDASIVMLASDLRSIARARVLSRLAMTSARQNLVFAVAYNVVGVASVAGAWFPLAGSALSPTLSALAMTSATMAVIGNALRLRRLQL